MKHKIYNRLLSLALALGLVVGMLPGMTFAGAVEPDSTALQSQVEQIAEPTEEPETVSEESSQAEATPTPASESSEEESSVVSSQVEETPAPTEEPVQEPENNEDTESAFIPPVNYTNVAPLEKESSPALPAMNRMNLLSVGRESESTTDNGLELNKTVTGNRENGYQVQLEAYTTGTVTSTTSTKPADIVLVLDVSGSMDDCICGHSKSNHSPEPVYSNALDTNKVYYYRTGNGFYSSYEPLYYCEGNGAHEAGWYTERHSNSSHGGTRYTPKTYYSQWDGTQFYRLDCDSWNCDCDAFESRMDALRTAVDAFLDSVQAERGGRRRSAWNR